ncbi:hypothetical protein ES705_23279 [subsurface metagenome]
MTVIREKEKILPELEEFLFEYSEVLDISRFGNPAEIFVYDQDIR